MSGRHFPKDPDFDPIGQGAAELLDTLYLLGKTVGSHGPRHQLSIRAAEVLRTAAARAQPPISLQFVAGGVFRDRKIVPLDVDRYRRSKHLSRALANVEAQELTFDTLPEINAILELGAIVARGANGPGYTAPESIGAIHLREIVGVSRGEEAERIDPELFIAAQVALAFAGADEIFAEQVKPWPWATGLTIVRRLERAIQAAPDGSTQVARAIETAPVAWSVPRRAVSATFRVLDALLRLQVVVPTQRGAAHAMLAAAISGLQEREGHPLSTIGKALVPRLLAGKLGGRARIDPHRLMVTALVHALDRGEASNHPVLDLLKTCYALELRRCPRKTPFDLSFIDLLAQGVGDRTLGCDVSWMKQLISAAGAVPAGTRVQLADGKVGIALESTDPASRYPPVLVGGLVVQPDRPLKIISSYAEAKSTP